MTRPSEEEITEAANDYLEGPDYDGFPVGTFKAGARWGLAHGLDWKRPEPGFVLVSGMEVVRRCTYSPEFERWVIGDVLENGENGGCGCCSDRRVRADEVVAYRELSEVELPEWCR